MASTITTNSHSPSLLPRPATSAMEPPASSVPMRERATTHRRNTSTVASQIFTKSMYTGFQRPRSAPTWAFSTSRLLKLYSRRMKHSTVSTRPSTIRPPMAGVNVGSLRLVSSSASCSAPASSGDSICKPKNTPNHTSASANTGQLAM
ncbi:hypothetical protein D3C72_1614530 [compost metagenome]